MSTIDQRGQLVMNQTNVVLAQVPASVVSQPGAPNLFDSVEPHRHLHTDARRSLWTACQLVLSRPDDFSETVGQLEKEYSEAVQREWCERKYRHDFAYQLVRERRESATFWRRLAIQRGRPLQELRQQSVQEACFRGRKLEGERPVMRQDRVGMTVDEANVHLVWRWEDKEYRRQVRELRAERRNARWFDYDRPQDIGWRLKCALNDAMRHDLQAGKEQQRHGRRVVVLACLLSWPYRIPMSGEFCSWEWDDTGHFADALFTSASAKPSDPYVPGRNTILFPPWEVAHDCGSVGTAVWLGIFTDLVARALNVLAFSP